MGIFGFLFGNEELKMLERKILRLEGEKRLILHACAKLGVGVPISAQLQEHGFLTKEEMYLLQSGRFDPVHNPVHHQLLMWLL